MVVFGYITFGCNRDSTNKTTISVVFAKSTKQSLRGVFESVLASSVVVWEIMGSSYNRVKPKPIKLVCVASLLRTKY